MGRNYTIGITDMTGQNPPRNVVSAAGDWEGPSWAPDDRHVVCSRSQGGASTLYVVDTWTGKTRQLLNVRHSCTMPAWSGIIGK
jgi:TolB protein